jgi:cell division protein ZapA
MMKQLEVQIMGQSYLLGCPPDGDARLLDAVNRVDLAMCKIRDSGKIKARDRIAVLAALNLAFDVPEVPKIQTEIVHLAVTPSQESAQLAALLTRLDTALGQDGQLL